MKGYKNALLVGVSGKMRHGKDALGGFLARLADESGYRVYRRAFGDALKEEVAEFLAMVTADHAKLGKTSCSDRYDHFLKLLHVRNVEVVAAHRIGGGA